MTTLRSTLATWTISLRVLRLAWVITTIQPRVQVGCAEALVRTKLRLSDRSTGRHTGLEGHSRAAPTAARERRTCRPRRRLLQRRRRRPRLPRRTATPTSPTAPAAARRPSPARATLTSSTCTARGLTSTSPGCIRSSGSRGLWDGRPRSSCRRGRLALGLGARSCTSPRSTSQAHGLGGTG